MRTLRAALLGALLASAIIAPMPSHATVIQGVTIRDVNPNTAGLNHHQPRVDPRALTSTPGWQVRWYHQDTGDITHHTITAYHGATFASGAIAFNDSFQAPYAGGTVLYRCLYHSSLDERVSPPGCTGMCGAIHDSTADATPPSVSIGTANGFVFTGPVRIDGLATDNRAVTSVKVRLRPVLEVTPPLAAKELVSTDGDAMNPCIGCHGPSAAWTVRQDATIAARMPVFSLAPGQYRVEVEARDPHGNVGHATPIVIYVLR